MHAGMYGLLESAMRGVPVITVPVFGDQLRNGKVAEYRGFGYNIDKNEFDGHTLKIAIETVLNNERLRKIMKNIFVQIFSYKESALRLSKLMRNKPFTAEERFLKWTNFVVEHGRIPELQPEGVTLSFIEYFCLDIFFIGSCLLMLLIYLTYRIFKLLAKMFS